MARHEPCAASRGERKLFFEITKFAFSHRRKQLKTLFRDSPESLSFSTGKALDAFRELGINATARPENLSVEDWLLVVRSVYRTLTC